MLILVLILGRECTIFDSLLMSPWKSIHLVKFIHHLWSVSLRVVYYAIKTIFIIYLQTCIRRNFHGKNHVKLVYFFHPVEHHSRSLGSVDQSTHENIYLHLKIYIKISTYFSFLPVNVSCSGCTRKIWATFGVRFKFLTLLVFETSDTQKSGYWKNVKKCVC